MLATPLRLSAFVLFVSVALSARAEAPFAVGDTLPAIQLSDQFGEPRTIDANTRLVLFGRDMDAGKVLKAAMEGGDGAELLEGASAAYVSDVSRMPSLVRRLFAYPSLRRRGYPILLDEQGTATARFPGEEGKATLIRLDAGRVVAIDLLEDPAAVRAELEARARSASQEPETEE